jgi:hypothetical protein
MSSDPERQAKKWCIPVLGWTPLKPVAEGDISLLNSEFMEIVEEGTELEEFT